MAKVSRDMSAWNRLWRSDDNSFFMPGKMFSRSVVFSTVSKRQRKFLWTKENRGGNQRRSHATIHGHVSVFGGSGVGSVCDDNNNDGPGFTLATPLSTARPKESVLNQLQTGHKITLLWCLRQWRKSPSEASSYFYRISVPVSFSV